MGDDAHPASAMTDGPRQKRQKQEALQLAPRSLRPEELVFGCSWLGPSGDPGHEDQGQDNADRTVAAAVAAGITEFDTAPWYGAGGSEERLGRAVSKLPPGTAYKISTKTGRLVYQPDGKTPCTVSLEGSGSTPFAERIFKNDYTAKGATQSHADSVARMGVESVFGLRIHDPNDNSTSDKSVDEVAAALAPEGMLEGLRALRKEGKIQHVGLGMNCNQEPHQGVPDDVLRLIRGAPTGTLDSALLAGGWNLLSQKGLPCLLECQRRGVAVHLAGAFASGALVGLDRYAYKSVPADVAARVDRWRALGSKYGFSLPALAIAFAALPTVVSRVVVGMSSPSQVEDTLSLIGSASAVPTALWAEARAEGLLDAAVPVPEEAPTLRVAARSRTPGELMFGGIWIAPGFDNDGRDLGQDNADRTVAAAVAAGITEFDTAPWYGAGCAEERLGRALQKIPKGSAKVITKAGGLVAMQDGKTPCTVSFEDPGAPSWQERVVRNDYTAGGAAASLSESLARMQLDSVHGLRIHDPNDNSNYDGSVDEVAVALAPGGMLEGLRQLREEGRIQQVGLGMNCNRETHMGAPDQVVRLLRGAPEGTFDSCLLAGGWNLLSQEGLPCLLECQRRGIEVHIAGVFASGLLVGVDRYAYKSAPAGVAARAARWRELAAKHGCSLPAVALSFASLPAVVSRVVLGMATADQVEQSLATLSEAAKVPASIWRDAKEAGLLGEQVPLPE